MHLSPISNTLKTVYEFKSSVVEHCEVYKRHKKLDAGLKGSLESHYVNIN